LDPEYVPANAKDIKISPVVKWGNSERSKVEVPMSDVKPGHSGAMRKKKLEHAGDDLAAEGKKSKSADSAAKVVPPKPVEDYSAAKVVPPKPVEDYSSAKVKVRKHSGDATDKDKSSRKKRKHSESSEERDSFAKRMEQKGQMLLARMQAFKEQKKKNAE